MEKLTKEQMPSNPEELERLTKQKREAWRLVRECITVDKEDIYKDNYEEIIAEYVYPCFENRRINNEKELYEEQNYDILMKLTTGQITEYWDIAEDIRGNMIDDFDIDFISFEDNKIIAKISFWYI
jgi:hypothetical protein